MKRARVSGMRYGNFDVLHRRLACYGVISYCASSRKRDTFAQCAGYLYRHNYCILFAHCNITSGQFGLVGLVYGVVYVMLVQVLIAYQEFGAWGLSLSLSLSLRMLRFFLLFFFAFHNLNKLKTTPYLLVERSET